MQYFDYVSKNPTNGKLTKGVITADDMESAVNSLKSRGIIIIEISPLKDFLNLRQIFYKTLDRVTKRDIQEFFDQLAFMLETDLQLYSALLTLRDFSVNKKMQIIAKPIAEYIRKGIPLNEAFEKSGFFKLSTIQQVKSGEESGDVPKTLKRISDELVRELEFSSKIKSAMTYPIIITIVMIGVLWVLLTMVVPSLAKTLSNLGGELPLITKLVIGASTFMSKATPFLIVFIIAIVVTIKMLYKNEEFKLIFDSIKLKIPIIGGLIVKIEMSRFCRNLAAMQHCGITLVRSLIITQSAIKNSSLRKTVEEATKMVEISGMNLSSALSKAGGFPELMIQLIEVGVSTGNIAEVLEKTALQYEKDVDSSLKKITGLIEPIMIIIVGALAGTVVISMFLPMFSVIDNL